MTTNETYRRSRDRVLALAPMSAARFVRLPEWMKVHLQNLINQFDDLEIALNAALNAPPPDVIVDHSMRELPRKGRYDGDLHAELTVLPSEKKPYTVRVWRFDDFGWREMPNQRRSYRKAEAATHRLGDIRSDADAKVILDRINKVRQAARIRVA